MWLRSAQKLAEILTLNQNNCWLIFFSPLPPSFLTYLGDLKSLPSFFPGFPSLTIKHFLSFHFWPCNISFPDLRNFPSFPSRPSTTPLPSLPDLQILPFFPFVTLKYSSPFPSWPSNTSLLSLPDLQILPFLPFLTFKYFPPFPSWPSNTSLLSLPDLQILPSLPFVTLKHFPSSPPLTSVHFPSVCSLDILPPLIFFPVSCFMYVTSFPSPNAT